MGDPRWRVPLSVPDVGPAEQAAVADAIASGWVAPAGPALDAFEQEVAAACGRRFAVGLSSGTAALHLGLLTAGARAGDVVICSTLTFVATVNAAAYLGAEPLLVDCDESGNLDPELIDSAIRWCVERRRRIGAIVPVDVFGKVADYAAIEAVAARFRIPIVADAAESLGSTRGDRPAGSFGVAAAVSFNGNKIVTTSGGGALVTDDEHRAVQARMLAAHARERATHYEHARLGYAYRLSGVLAALGRAQLARLPEFLAARRAHRDAYRHGLGHLPGVTFLGGPDAGDNCWLTAVEIDPERAGLTALEAGERLASLGIETRPVWKPMHRQPLYEHCPRVLRGVSDRMFARGLVLPSSSNLTPAHRAEVIAGLLEAWEERA